MGIERFDFFEESQQRICLWCRYGIVHVGYELGEYDAQRVSCMRHARDETRQPKAMKPLPVSVRARTWTPTFNADESRDCFVPTPRDSNKAAWMERLGLL